MTNETEKGCGKSFVCEMEKEHICGVKMGVCPEILCPKCRKEKGIFDTTDVGLIEILAPIIKYKFADVGTAEECGREILKIERTRLKAEVEKSFGKLIDTIKNNSVKAFRINDRVRVINWINLEKKRLGIK